LLHHVTSGIAPLSKHEITRVRHELRRRLLTVSAIEKLTPQMLRITLTSPDLHDFVSASYDDHVKLMFPGSDDTPVMREYTPRRFDNATNMLVIDFALHEAGPATQWAEAAKVGDTLQIGGPRGSAVLPDDFDWVVMIGDETALPAIGRRLEELRTDVPVVTFVIGDAQQIATKANWTPLWISRDGKSDDAALLRAALDKHVFPAGEGFVWIAAEANVARSLRSYVVETRGHPKAWTKAAGYWTRGQADTSVKSIED
jgi:NADPH-dependent ferric siderophore reductase